MSDENEEILNEIRNMDEVSLYNLYIAESLSSPHEITTDDIDDVQLGIRNIKKEIEHIEFLIKSEQISPKKGKRFILDLKKVKSSSFITFDIRDTSRFDPESKRIRVVPHQAKVILWEGDDVFQIPRYYFRNELDRRIGKMRNDLLDHYSGEAKLFEGTFD